VQRDINLLTYLLTYRTQTQIFKIVTVVGTAVAAQSRERQVGI